jgi:hypothetical protein
LLREVALELRGNVRRRSLRVRFDIGREHLRSHGTRRADCRRGRRFPAAAPAPIVSAMPGLYPLLASVVNSATRSRRSFLLVS